MLLRELARDVVELLRVFVGSTSFPSVPAAQLASLGSTNPHAFSTPRRVRGAPPRLAALLQASAESPGHSPRGSDRSSRPADGKGGPPLNSVPWEQTMACALLPVRLLTQCCRCSLLHSSPSAVDAHCYTPHPVL